MSSLRGTLLAAVAALALMVPVTATSAVRPAGIVPPSGSPAGTLSTIPATYFEGQRVEVMANFPSGRFDVTLFEETSSGSGDYTSVAVDETNKNGNAYFKGYLVDGSRTVFARAKDGRHTAVLTFEPTAADPSGPASGTLTTDPASYFNGQTVKLAANFADGVFDVVFLREDAPGSGTFQVIGTDETSKHGNAYLSGYAVLGSQAVFALTEDGRHTALTSLVPKLPDFSASPTGELSTVPRRVSIGDTITLKASFLYRCRKERVNFFGMTGSGIYLGSARIEETVGDRSAAAYLRKFKITRQMKVVALTEGSCGSKPGVGPSERTDSDGIP